MAGAVAIGGSFFRSKDPTVMAAWYAAHLGMTVGVAHWQQQAGPMVFAPFKADSGYFPADRQWMVNFRVDDVTALIAPLRVSKIPVETRPEWAGEWGRFARIDDPAGNPLELWEAPAA